ncbi:helix-turn-helix domain-containing protein [Sphingomonas sp. ASY06-1R]|jgi:hypothetical protein|uniref:helix-turn-helix domain-containing protein n=1 Tax=Sphingomonas sp. ASY06-1R TaxID=3445771 RepID=UPI003FA1DD67
MLKESHGHADDTSAAPKLAYTLKEAIAATGIGKTSLYDDMAAGRLTAKKRGTSTIILTDELRRYLAELPNAEIKS